MRAANQPSPAGVPKHLLIAEIIVPENRKRSAHDTTDLQASIEVVGLLQPIVVTQEKVLVAGLHRKLACEALGWKTIAALVVSLNQLDAELAEIDENLCRTELTVLERAEQTVRRKQLYEARYPQAKHGGAKGIAGGGKAPRTKDEIIASFANDTSGRTGVSPRNVELDAQIAQGIALAVRDAIRNSPLADRRVDLIALAQLGDPEEQASVVELILGGEAKTVAAARKLLAQDDADGEASEPSTVFDQTGREVTDPDLAEAFTILRGRMGDVVRHLRAAQQAWGHFHEEQIAARRMRILGAKSYLYLRPRIEEELHRLASGIRLDAPYAVCPYCQGAPYDADHPKPCEACLGGGWVAKSTYDSAPPETKFQPDLDDLPAGDDESNVLEATPEAGEEQDHV